MSYLTRSEMIGGIIGTLYEFSCFCRENKKCVSGYVARTENLAGYAEQSYRLLNAQSTRITMMNMLKKLNDEALMEMYRKCGALAEKYELPVSEVKMIGYRTVELAKPAAIINNPIKVNINNNIQFMASHVAAEENTLHGHDFERAGSYTPLAFNNMLVSNPEYWPLPR